MEGGFCKLQQQSTGKMGVSQSWVCSQFHYSSNVLALLAGGIAHNSNPFS
jgi:hypothetical protein